VERLDSQLRQQAGQQAPSLGGSDRFRRQLERQENQGPRRLRGAPRRVRLQRPD
jgi:hypothetical protein